MILTRMKFALGLVLSAIILASCGDESESTADAEIVRGLKAFKVSESANSMARRYPSIVTPAQDSLLSFEVGGQLLEIDLEEGQRVSAGEVLAELDPRSLTLQVEQAQAALDQAQASYDNALADVNRKQPLLANGFVTEADFERSESTMKSSFAQVEQAQKQLDIANENLAKSKLVAPFDGLIASIEAESFANVSPGQTILELYSEGAFELSVSVPATVINALSLGQEVRARFSDFSNAQYPGRISEIGSRAAQVSAFPVVVALDESPPGLKAGMAAEVELDVSLEGEMSGILIPLSAIATGGQKPDTRMQGQGTVFVFDPETSTVRERAVQSAGLRENMLIIVAGLEEGELIAAAGVSFLLDGQKVKLLPLDQ